MTTPDPERRVAASRVELRAARAGSTSPGTLAGYAAMFERDSVPLPMPDGKGLFREQIMPGAFKGCDSGDVRCLRNHLDDVVLGRTSNGSLRIEEDADGLRYECDLPDTTHGRDTAEMVRSGLMDGCSFQFDTPDGGDSWEFPKDDHPRRSVHKVGRLYDVGPVTFPAYKDTRVSMRSYEAAAAALAQREADALQQAAYADQMKAQAERLKQEATQTAIDMAKARQRLAEAELPPAPQ